MLRYFTFPVTPFRQNCSVVYDDGTPQSLFAASAGADIYDVFGRIRNARYVATTYSASSFGSFFWRAKEHPRRSLRRKTPSFRCASSTRQCSLSTPVRRSM